MATIDYEKKYKEALGWMQSLYDGLHGATKEDAEHYFPELKESEDERIRKEIINYFKCQSREEPSRKDIHNKWITWLEKQGEQNPNPCDGCINRKGCINCENGELRETEQKPNPYSGTSFEYNGHTWGMCARDNGVEILIDGHIKGRVFTNDSNDKEMFIKALERVEEQNSKGYKLTDYDKNSWWEDFKAYTSCTIEQKLTPTDFSDLRTWKYIVDAVWTEKEGIGQYLDSPFTEEIAKKLQKRFGNIELKPADKVEPKFKVGDWLVHKNLVCVTCCITQIHAPHYYITNHNSFINFGEEDNYRPWTIQDAKDGDVLIDHCDDYKNPLIFILKKFETVDFGLAQKSDYSSYCFLSMSDKPRFKEGYFHHMHDIKPATKEQRDLLFSKMKEAGYEWDAEKKELKKIEQKSADKIEPKFKVGDWVIDRRGITDKITNVIENVTAHTYGYDTLNGEYFNDYTEDVRLWTIQDAKDGDVVVDKSDGAIGIFQSIGHHPDGGSYNDPSYCFLHCRYDDGFFYADFEHGNEMDSDDIIPATKEQRDLLFQKLKEAGYEWDAEKKELKKIEQSPVEEVNGEDYGIDGLWHAHSILEKTLGKVDGYQSDDGILEHKCAISAVKKLYEQNHAWSEEDESKIRHLIAFLDTNPNSVIHLRPKEEWIGWLKSLKDRVFPQQKKEWGEEDENRMKKVMHILSLDGRISNKELESILNWLKSLRPQSHWKPSEEQMKALGVATNISNVPEKEYQELEKLYQDLKKLK